MRNLILTLTTSILLTILLILIIIMGCDIPYTRTFKFDAIKSKHTQQDSFVEALKEAGYVCDRIDYGFNMICRKPNETETGLTLIFWDGFDETHVVISEPTEFMQAVVEEIISPQSVEDDVVGQIVDDILDKTDHETREDIADDIIDVVENMIPNTDITDDKVIVIIEDQITTPDTEQDDDNNQQQDNDNNQQQDNNTPGQNDNNQNNVTPPPASNTYYVCYISRFPYLKNNDYTVKDIVFEVETEGRTNNSIWGISLTPIPINFDLSYSEYTNVVNNGVFEKREKVHTERLSKDKSYRVFRLPYFPSEYVEPCEYKSYDNDANLIETKTVLAKRIHASAVIDNKVDGSTITVDTYTIGILHRNGFVVTDQEWDYE